MGFNIEWKIPKLSDAVLRQVAAEVFADAKDDITDGLVDAARKPHQNVYPGRTWSNGSIWRTSWEVTPPKAHEIKARPENPTGQLHFFWSKRQLASSTHWRPLHEYPWASNRWRHEERVFWHPDYPPRREIYEPVISKTRRIIAAKLAEYGPEIVALFGA